MSLGASPYTFGPHKEPKLAVSVSNRLASHHIQSTRHTIPSFLVMSSGMSTPLSLAESSLFDFMDDVLDAPETPEAAAAQSPGEYQSESELEVVRRQLAQLKAENERLLHLQAASIRSPDLVEPGAATVSFKKANWSKERGQGAREATARAEVQKVEGRAEIAHEDHRSPVNREDEGYDHFIVISVSLCRTDRCLDG